MVKTLTSIRFFFALLVFLSHIHLFKDNSLTLEKINLFYFTEFKIGVSFFYILSGFILTYTYNESILLNTFSFKEFIIKRITKLYPLHILTLILSVPLSLNGFRRETAFWFTKLIINGILIQSWFLNDHLYWSFNAPSWSISNELFYYLVFPIIIIHLSKSKLNQISIIIYLSGIILISYLLIGNQISADLLNINPLIRLSDFIIGILLCKIFLKIKFIRISYFTMSILEISSLLILFLLYNYRLIIPLNFRYAIYYWIPISLFILLIAYQKGIISSILNNKILVKLGEISFSFYLIHMIVARYVKEFLVNKSIITNELIIISLVFTISIILSYFSFIFIETKLRKIITYRLKLLANP